MDFAIYSIFIIGSFAVARWVTENLNFHLRSKRFWIHHWNLAAAAMLIILVLDVRDVWVWGVLTGVALEGIRRDNWSMFR